MNMDIQVTLKEFKARLDPKIAAYFDKTIAEAKLEDDLVCQALEHVKTMTLAGGKRLRPASEPRQNAGCRSTRDAE